jgi:transposase
MQVHSYPTDLTDAEWLLLAPLIPAVKPGGRPAIHERREIVDAIRYLLRAGCAWRLLPQDLPPWQTVYHYFRLWRKADLWEAANRALREQVRSAAGRNAQPSAGVLDSQSVKTTEKGGSMAMTGRRRSMAASAI